MFTTAIAHGVELRPLEVRHAEQFAEHLDRAREHIRPWVGLSFVTETVDGARATLARYAAATAADGARLYGIWSEERLIGGVMYVTFNADAGVCEIGCWLEPDGEGRGLVTAAAAMLVHQALDVRGLDRAEWRCRADNVRSAAVARRLGMRLEGTLRGAWYNGGAFHDEQVWAVHRRDRSDAERRRATVLPEHPGVGDEAMAEVPHLSPRLRARPSAVDDDQQQQRSGPERATQSARAPAD